MLAAVLPSQTIPRLQMAPKMALQKNTLEGEKRSVKVNRAKIKVPIIKPNCTAEVISPKPVVSKLKWAISETITPFPANHKEVHKN